MSESVEQNERAFDKALEDWANRMKALQALLASLGEYSARTLIKASIGFAIYNPYEAFVYLYLLKKLGIKGARMGARIGAQEIAQKVTWGKIIAEESARGTRAQNIVFKATGRSRAGMTLTQRLAAREARRRTLSAATGLSGSLLAADLYLAFEEEVSESINEGLGLTRGVAEHGVAPPSFISGGTTF